MRLRRNLSLYWRLLASYLLVILVGCFTLYLAGDAFSTYFYEQHMSGMGNMGMMDAMTADLNEAYQRATQRAMAWGVGIAALVASAVGLFVTGRIVKPLKQMQHASRRVASGQYRERLDAQAPGEIGELAQAFNDMAAVLESTERRRLELLNNVAHEFRTPLSSLRGYVDGLAEGVFEADTATLSACQRQISRLERLAADLSLLSRAETGQETFKPQRTEAATLLEGVVASFRPQTREKGVDLIVEPVPKGLLVHADVQRTSQVLGNLVSNALRHTPIGGEVRLSVQPSEEGQVMFRVRDTGEGIAAEHLLHIFTRFYRADPARMSGDDRGSGIGLTIAKHYVELQGGRIGVESQPGQGSLVWFTLPGAGEVQARPSQTRGVKA